MFRVVFRNLVNVSLYPVGSSYRLKINLPGSGECWFTVDSTQDMTSFLKELENEDKTIFEASTENPYKIFREGAEEGIRFTINNIEYLMKRIATAEGIESRSLIDSFIDRLERADVNSKKELTGLVNQILAELGEQFGTYLSVLKNSVDEIDQEIKAISKKEEEIIRQIRFRSTLLCSGIFGLLAAQWGFFYFTIYEVDWLGWDLMEPITFTVGQSSFVLSIFYYLKTQTTQSYETMLSRYESKRKTYLLNKHGVDVGRIRFLQEEKNRILSLIDVIEKRLV
jgi:hypothetical protein